MTAEPNPGKASLRPEVSFDDFKKIDLAIATIRAVEDVPGKDKLLKLSIDLGEESLRTIVSGIKLVYSKKEDLVGKQIVVVANLAPRKIAGIESRGMLLACGDGIQFLSLLTPDKACPPGTPVE